MIKMKKDNNYSMYEYIRLRDKGDNREVIGYYGKKIRTDEFYREIHKISLYLSDIGGVKRGDSVAVCLPNIPNAIISFYAVNRIGAVVNLIHPLIPQMGLKEILNKIESKVIFILDMFYEKYKTVLKDAGIRCIVCSSADYLGNIKKLALKIATYSKVKKITESEKVIKYRNINVADITDIVFDDTERENVGEEIAAYIHSGGTTGSPKTVMLSNRAINECSYDIRTLIGEELPDGSGMLMVLPLFHVFGLGVCMHSTISAGCSVVQVPIFKPKSICRLMRKQKINYICGVPSMYDKLMKCKSFGGNHLRALKACYCGGDKLKQDLIIKFDDIMSKYGADCTLSEGYGLSEAAICTVNVRESAHKGSVGKPIGDIKLKIIDNNGITLPYNKKGEICIGGDSVMSGYYNDEETTKEVLSTDEAGITWVKTGDCGYIEESGHLYFVDRYKRMLKISGINVFPSEIEQLVYDNIKEVERCAVTDMKFNGKTAVKLYVQMYPDNEFNDFIKNKILNVIGERLMKYSLPRSIVALDKIPLTEIGKVDYKKLEIKEKINEHKREIS